MNRGQWDDDEHQRFPYHSGKTITPEKAAHDKFWGAVLFVALMVPTAVWIVFVTVWNATH